MPEAPPVTIYHALFKFLTRILSFRPSRHAPTVGIGAAFFGAVFALFVAFSLEHFPRGLHIA